MSRPTSATGAFAGIGFVVMWSSGFVGARLGTDSAGTVTVLLWRLGVAAALLLGWRWWRHRRVRQGACRQPRPRHRFGRRELGLQMLIGTLAQGVYLIGVVGSVELGVPVGTSALIAALQPVLAGTLAGPLLGERVSLRQWLGLGLGLVGVALVVSGDLGVGSQTPLWAYTLPFLGMAGLVAATLIERVAGLRTPLPDALTVQTATSAGLLLVLAAVTGQLLPLASGSTGFWLAIGWTVAFSHLGGYGFYWLNARQGSVTRVSSLLYLTPPTTMVWAAVMFGAPVTPLALLGVLVSAAGVLGVQATRVRAVRATRCFADAPSPGCSATPLRE